MGKLDATWVLLSEFFREGVFADTLCEGTSANGSTIHVAGTLPVVASRTGD